MGNRFVPYYQNGNYDTFGAKRAKSRNAGPKEKDVIYYPDLKEDQRVIFTYKRYFELSKTMSDIEIIQHLNINKATFYRRKKKMLEDIEYMQEMDPEYLYYFKASEIEFIADEEVPWTLDGENGGAHKSVLVENRKQAMKIYTGKKH